MHRTALGIWRWTPLPPAKKIPPASHLSVSLCCLSCRLSRVSWPVPVFPRHGHQPQGPRQSQAKKANFFSSIVAVSWECLERRTEERTRLEPTAIGGELWIACEGTGVSTGGRAHSPCFFFFCSSDQGVQRVCKFLCECLETCLSGNRP